MLLAAAAFAVLLALVAFVSRVAAYPNLFQAPGVFETGHWPPGSPQGGQAFAAATGDLNLDGHLDLVVANFGDENGIQGQGHTVSVLFGSPAPIVPPLFQAKVDYDTDPGPNGVVLVDLDFDSDLDIVTANPGTNPAAASLSVLLNNGNGTFQPFVSYPLAGVVGPIAAADVNGDNAPDIVMAVSSPVGFAVMIGDGGGAINVPVFYPSGASQVRGLALRDVTGDGRADAITANGTDNTVTVFRGSVSGVFSLVGTFATGSNATDVTVDYLSGDALADLAVAARDANAVSILINAGAGTFPLFSNLPCPKAWPWSVRAADLTGDFEKDLVVSMDGSGPGSVGTVAVLRGHGDGTFDPAAGFDGVSGPGQVVLGDFDVDGAVDVAVPSRGDPTSSDPTHSICVFLNDGGGRLIAPTHVAVLPNPRGTIVGDFNGDGDGDAAVALDAAVQIFTGNGLGAFSPLTTIALPSFTGRIIQAADVDRDGDIDLLVQQGTDVQLCANNGNGTFAAPVTKVAGFTMLPGSIADMNRDARPDVILIAGNGSIRVFTQDVNGNFVSAGIGAPPGTAKAFQVEDVNRDGKPDLAVAGTGGLGVLLGNGDGTVGPLTTLNAGVSYAGVCAGDFNRDGNPDLAARERILAAGIGTKGVDVFLGNGSGGFGVSTSFATLDPVGESIGAWDLNKDGIPDIVAESHATGATASGQPSSVGILLGDGQGQFQKRSDYAFGSVPFAGSTSAAFGEVNGDLDPDVVGLTVDPLPGVTRYLSAMVASPIQQNSALNARTDYLVGPAPEDVAVGDLDRDGILDMVAAATGALSSVAVRLGNGDGTFGPAALQAQTLTARRVRLGDLNRDGILDLATMDPSGVRVSVMMGAGDGTFGARVDHSVVGGSDLEIADTNRDGILDLCVSETAGMIRVFPGIGNGTFGVSQITGAPADISDLELADIDSDGDLDVVAANHDVVYMPGIGGFQFGPWTLNPMGAFRIAVQLAVEDMNRDGNLDVVVPTEGGSPFNLATLLGAGTGQFGAPQLTLIDHHPRNIVIGHGENDGDLFAYMSVADGIGNDSLLVYKSLGNGLFEPTGAIYPTGDNPRGLVLGDFNRDGLPDVALADSSANTVSIHLHGKNAITGVEAIAASGAPRPPAHLAQNYPNPFNPLTTIRFSTEAAARARLAVFDVRGRLVTTLLNGRVSPGEHEIRWSGRCDSGAPAASGVYLYRLDIEDGWAETRKMILAR